ncbi:hypothetical protein [Novosphingobium sp. Fuku2-ISO-50]|nr:hypothetical protein [Novosphingobium sp. Fuku2-ISO-50]
MAHKYLRQLTTYLGQRYGGKHSRHSANEVALETQKKRHSALRLRQAG